MNLEVLLSPSVEERTAYQIIKAIEEVFRNRGDIVSGYEPLGENAIARVTYQGPGSTMAISAKIQTIFQQFGLDPAGVQFDFKTAPLF
jgi:hypothetical protein